MENKLFKIKGWSSFQSYKDRNPPWIRLHKRLLDDFNFQRMSADARALLPMLWLMASEDKDPASGMLRIGYEEIAFRLRIDGKAVKSAIDETIRGGFVERLGDPEMPIFDQENQIVTKPYPECYETVTQRQRQRTETDSKIVTRAKPNVDRVTLKDLGVHHIAEWLDKKRVAGIYTNVDEHLLLEMFKDYCLSKNPDYKDYVAAFRNAFGWKSVPYKQTIGGIQNGKSYQPTRSERISAALDDAVEHLNRLDEETGEEVTASLFDRPEPEFI